MRKPSTKMLPAVRFCPYCGHHDLTQDDDQFRCMACGSLFGLTKLPGALSYQPRTQQALLSSVRARVGAYDTFVLHEISRIASTLNLPREIVRSASVIYGRAVTEGLVSGKSIPGIVAASLYVACMQNGITISLEKIATTLSVDKKEIEHHYRSLLNEWGYIASLAQPPKLDLGMTRFLEKKGAYAFLALLKEKPRRWKTFEKEITLSPRSLSERISEALDLGLIEKVRRLKIGATYYKLTKKGNEVFEAATKSTRIY